MKIKSKSNLKKKLGVLASTKGAGNKLSEVRKVNLINQYDIILLSKHEKLINGMGIIVDYRCAGVDENSQMCLGRLKRKKYGAICTLCKSKWVK